jgi:hypothetical protein
MEECSALADTDDESFDLTAIGNDRMVEAEVRDIEAN